MTPEQPPEGTGRTDRAVRTGSLPGWDDVETLVHDAHESFRSTTDGSVATYIPALADADPDLFGVCVAEVDGEIHGVGDVDRPFSLQSVSKAFVWALVCEQAGHAQVLDVVGVNNTGQAFDSVMALELHDGHPRNPMANAGAIATTSHVVASTPDDRWDTIRTGLSRFAGRDLEIDAEVYASESSANQRNLALALLLETYGRLEEDPAEVVDVYTKQCSLLVTARDLAVMGATLANGGVNPATRERVVSGEVSRDTLAVLAASGLYERSGEWLFEIGLPAKSGVSGGIVSVAPGKAGIGTFSPPLDDAGNSVRGRQAHALLSRTLGLDVFASAPYGGA